MAIGDGARFYRPAVRAWFLGAGTVCVPATSCYHLLHLGLHAAKGLLLFTLAFQVTRDRLTACLTTGLFMVMPATSKPCSGCARDEVLSATLMLLTGVLALPAADTGRFLSWWLATASALLKVLAHESGIAALPLVPAPLWLTDRRSHVGTLIPAASAASLGSQCSSRMRWTSNARMWGGLRVTMTSHSGLLSI